MAADEKHVFVLTLVHLHPPPLPWEVTAVKRTSVSD